MFTRGGVEDTRLKAKDTKKKSEAKDSPSEDRPSRGQEQECSRPRTQAQAGPARGGFRGYIVPGPRGARKSSGFRVKFWYGTITPQQNLPTEKKISVSLFSTGNWSLFLLHPIVADLIKKKRKMNQKPYTCTKINVLLHFSDLRTLILHNNNVRGPTFPEIQKHFNLREQSQSWYTTLLSLSNSLYLYEFNRYLGLWSLCLQMTS